MEGPGPASRSTLKSRAAITRMPPEAHLEDQTCRICMGSSGKMYSLFKEKSEALHPICAKITFCAGIQIVKGDGLPSKICNSCLGDLKIAFKFKKLCLISDETLKKRKIIKKEVEENNDEYESEEYIDDALFADTYIDHIDDIKVDVKIETVNEPFVLTKDIERELRPRNKVLGQSKKRVTNIQNKEKPIKLEDKTQVVKPKQRRTRKPKLDCEKCHLTFKTKSLYASHNRSVHQKKVFVCEICGKVFRHQSSQSVHKTTHKEPRYHCDNCDYRTFYKQDLITHLRVHYGTRNYACPQCPLSFTTSSNRLAHVRRAHEKLKAYTCHVCGRGYVEKFELHRHIDAHSDVKRFTCEVCDGKFTRRSHLKRHLLRQHNIRLKAESRRRHHASQHASALQRPDQDPADNGITQETLLTSHAHTTYTSDTHSVLTSSHMAQTLTLH